MVMVKLSWADHLRMEAKKQKKSTLINPKSVDFYENDMLEKANDNSNSEVEIPRPEDKRDDEDHKFDFHEQYFS